MILSPARLLFFCIWLLSGTAASAQQHWLVRYRSDASHKQALPATVQQAPIYPGGTWQRWTLPAADSQAVQALGQDPAIAAIEPDHTQHTLLLPNDPGFGQQWALANNGQTGGSADIRALRAWDIGTGSAATVVAVIDAGVDWRHPDLIDNIWQNLGEDADGDGRVLEWNGSQWVFDPGDLDGIDTDGNGYADDLIGWDFADNDNDPSDDHLYGHGTHVAGIIAARGDNGQGIAGVSWRSRIMPIRFLNARGMGTTSGAIAALRYARIMGATLTNNSWGSGLYSQALLDELQLAAQAGIPCIAAAGNNFGNDNDVAPLYPASYALDHIIAVSASDLADSAAAFANVGLNSVDLFAPGYGIYSTLPGGNYGYLSGTSMAAPFVAGAVALVYSLNPATTLTQLRQLLLSRSQPRPGLRGRCVSGARLDLYRLLDRAPLFQRALPGTAYAAATWGDLLLAGQYQGSLWTARRSAAGAGLWTRLHAPGTWRGAAALAGGTAWLGGQQGTTPILAQIDSAGQPLWAATLGTSGAATHVAASGNACWAAGYSTDTDTLLWIARFDAAGALQWLRTLALPGDDLVPTALHGGDAPQLLARTGSGAMVWIKLQSDGALASAEALSQSDALRSEGTALLGDGEEAWLLGYQTLGDGSRRLLAIGWEEDDGYEWVRHLPLGATGGPVSAMLDSDGTAWLLCSGTDAAAPGLTLLQLENDGDRRFGTAYAWPGDTVQASWLGSTGPGALGMVARSRAGGSYWIQSNFEGRSHCHVVTGSNPQPTDGGNLVRSNPTLTQASPAWALTPFALVPGGAAAGDSVLCDNSACQTTAFFSLPSLDICEEGDLIPLNLSTAATTYTWLLDGSLVDQTAAPIIEAPDDEGDYTLSLVAQDGLCTDTFHLPIRVAPDLVLVQWDTLHCGPRLTLYGPDGAASYRWLDQQGSVLSETQAFTADSSGVFTVEVEDLCGNSASVSHTVTLQPGCVWPGDVDADGSVDMIDYLLMGLVAGETGPPRANASTAYTAQAATPWPQAFAAAHPWAPGINLAHADADGNGLVDVHADGAVVRQNYTQASLPPARTMTATTDISLLVAEPVVQVGDTARFDIHLERQDNQPIQGVYALALTLEYSIPVSRSLAIRPESGWLAAGGNYDTLVVRQQQTRQVQVGITRLDRQPVDGAGMVMYGGISIVIDDIGSYGVLAAQTFLTVSLTEAVLIRPDGSRIDLNPLGAQTTQTIVVQLDGGATAVEKPVPPSLSVYPNPSTGWVEVALAVPQAQPLSWSLLDMQGRVVDAGRVAVPGAGFRLVPRALPGGLYVLRVALADGGVQHEKIRFVRP
ncbi:MAG: hypothetical protein OHK0039_21380 [Bacteroidia bacterium]